MRYLLLRLKRFCGFITGFVFFIGGIFKLMDPVGAGLVMAEYFDFMHLKFLAFAAKPLAAAFALAEVLIGTALITGVWRKFTGIAALAFQGFFTLLTLALVIFNPQMDCGCFGEAIHLTHTETFVKNIVLFVLLCAYLFPAKLLGVYKKHKFVPFAIVSLSVIAFSVYSWMYIPMMDFTDYEPGALLKAAEGNSTDEDMYEAVFVYEKDGYEVDFDLEHLPDSTWTFVRTETRKIMEMESDGLIDLSISRPDGRYEDELAARGRVMVVSLYNTNLNTRGWEAISEFILSAEAAGFRTLVLVSDMPDAYLDFPIYLADHKTLLALNRSNGGVTYFNDGFLIRKWAARARPDLERLVEIAEEDATETVIYHNAKGSLAFQGFLLYVFAVMLLI